MDIILQKEDDIVILEMNTSKEISKLYKNYSYLFRIAGSRFYTYDDYSKKTTNLIIINNYPSSEAEGVGVLLFELRDSKYGIKRDMISSHEIYLPKQFKRRFNSNRRIGEIENG